MADLELKKPKKIKQSLFTNNFINYWTGEFADTERVTAESLQDEIETFAKMLESGFEDPVAFNRSAALLLKLFSLSHKSQQADQWATLIPKTIDRLNDSSIDIDLKIRLLNRFGHVYRIKNKRSQAAELHESALALIKKHEITDEFLQADCHHHLAENHYFNKNVNLAASHLDSVTQLASFKEFPLSFQATIHNLNGLIYQNLGHLEKSVAEFTIAVKLWKDCEEPIERARCLSNLGAVCVSLQQFDQAQEYFKEALTLNSNYPFEQCAVLNQYGLLYEAQGDLGEAINCWQKAKEILRNQAKTIDLTASVEHNLGYAYLNLNDFDAAENELQKAAVYWKKLQNKFELARTYSALGEVCHKREKYQIAVGYFDKVLEILQDFPSEQTFLEETIKEKQDSEKKIKERAADKSQQPTP